MGKGQVHDIPIRRVTGHGNQVMRCVMPNTKAVAPSCLHGSSTAEWSFAGDAHEAMSHNTLAWQYPRLFTQPMTGQSYGQIREELGWSLGASFCIAQAAVWDSNS